MVRTFRDGRTEEWWALEVDAGPYGPTRPRRAVAATTDPAELPEKRTWYPETSLPAPGSERERAQGAHPAADLAEVVRLYGLRMWVEQSYERTKHSLGWSEYQVRSDKAIRRHWALVCCASSFCWYGRYGGVSPPDAEPVRADAEPVRADDPPPRAADLGADPDIPAAAQVAGSGGIAPLARRPATCRPEALRAVWSWLEPYVALWRYWRAWSGRPPPTELAPLLDRLRRGRGLYLYGTY